MAKQALEIIAAEHRSLVAVMQAAKYLVADPTHRPSEEDLAALGAILRYIDEFPEQLHHPKEERLLFTKLRGRTSRSITLITELEEQHRRGNEQFHVVKEAFENLRQGNDQSVETFAIALTDFEEKMWRHMRLEEQELMPIAEQFLTLSDQEEIAEAFVANKDPLFGTPAEKQFRELYREIINMLPSPLGLRPSPDRKR